MKNNCKCLVCGKAARIDPDTNQQSEYCSKRCQKQAVKLKYVEACKICESYPRMLEYGQRVEWCSLDCKEQFLEENPNYKTMKTPSKIEKLTYKMNKVNITTDYEDISPPPSKKVPEKIEDAPSLYYYPKSVPTNLFTDSLVNEKSSTSNMDFNNDTNQINNNTNNISQVNKDINQTNRNINHMNNQNRNPNNQNSNRRNSNNKNPAIPHSQNYQHQSPANQNQSLAVQHQSPVVQHQCPAVQHQCPAIQQQSPVIQQQSPVIRQRSPVTQQQSPVTQQQSPVIQKQSPVIQQQSPVIQQQSPVIQQQSPVIRQRSPIIQQPSPVIRQKSPVIRQKSPVIRQPSSDIQQQSPAIQQQSPAIQQQSSCVQKQSSATQHQDFDTSDIQEDSSTQFNEGKNIIDYAAPHQPVQKPLQTIPPIVYMNNPNPQPVYVNNSIINPVNAYTMQPIISQTSAGNVVYLSNNNAISSTSQMQTKVVPAFPIELVNQIQPVKSGKQDVIIAQGPTQQPQIQHQRIQTIQQPQMFVTTPPAVTTYVINNTNEKNAVQPVQQQIPIQQPYQQPCQ
ncbi:10390_t:CDS:1, partial [Dentiscutata erythropus]